MKYKIILFNSKFYKEIKLDEQFKNGLLIGTSKECQIRFFREQFFTDFLIRIQENNGKWIMTCQDSIYLKKENAFKQYMQELNAQDVISVCYDLSDSELFQIEFAIDFGEENKDYNYRISLTGAEHVQIGGSANATICIENSSLLDEYVTLSYKDNELYLDQSHMRYQVYKNGFREKNNVVVLNNQDFFTLHSYSFYYKDGSLYTSKLFQIKTRLKCEEIKQQSNHLQYPCFVRSARQRFEIPEEKLEILPPTQKPEEPKKNMIATMLPTLVSMGMMLGMRMMMGSNIKMAIMCLGMGATGIVMSVINYKTDGEQYRKNIAKRENDYNKYIAEQEVKIEKIREKELLISKQKYPSVTEHVEFVEKFDARLFEKLSEHDDYLTICIGEGTVPAKNQVSFKEQEYRQVEDPLADYPEKVHDKYEYIENMPVILELKEKNAVGFIGERNQLYQMTKNMILLFSTEHYYQELKLFLIMEEEDAKDFYWARWIRNMTSGAIRNFAYDEDSNKVVLEYLYSELCEREKLKKDEKEGLPTFVVLVYRSQTIGKHPVSQYIAKAASLGFIFIFFEEHAETLNQFCVQRIFLNDKTNAGYIQNTENGEKVQSFQFEHIPVKRASAMAEKLACVYADEVSLEASLTKNITLYQLLGIMNAYDLEIEKRWSNSKIYESMAAPLGVKSGGEIVCLDLHEKYHGPHGLVAGTTGSGKSEIMQSYILSMATLFHPYEVGFIIIDFKGGGMVNQFRDLPHLNGAITNIDDGEIQRSLSSIKAELNKRQRLFAEHDVNQINEYIKLFKKGEAKTPLPHLILIVDEFAELKSEQPDFMKELISAARIGRSLGVHLILATQKPSGVVNDQIWSNSKFKLCLKVQDKSDSNEVLKSPLAAEIREPGRAYLQVGNNEIFQLFQSAYSGAPIPNSTLEAQKAFKLCKVNQFGGRTVIFEQKKQANDNSISQLDAIVEYIRDYCEKNHIERLPNICLPALSDNIPFQLEDYKRTNNDITVPLGIYDAPDIQYQGIFDINFSQGNTFIMGSSQMGKTNMLQTMIRGIASSYSSDEVQIYIMDFASMILRNFESLKHIGGVMVSTDEDKIIAFFKMMEEELVRRKEIFARLGLSSFSAYREAGQTELPQIIVMVDNIGVFRELYYNSEEQMIKLVREGSAVGISMVMTSIQTTGLGYKYLSNFNTRFALYCNDSSEYSTVIERCRMTLKQVPGRCLFSMDKKIFTGQIYQSFPAEREIEKVQEMKAFIKEMNENDKGAGAKRIPIMPERVTPELIQSLLGDELKPYKIPLGINYDNLDVDTLDMRSFSLLGINGQDELGRGKYVSYVVRCLLQGQANAPVDIHIVDDELGSMKEFDGSVKYYSKDIRNVSKIVEEIHQEMQARYELLTMGEIEKINKLPLICLVLQSQEACEMISEDEKTFDLLREILQKYRQLKVSILLANVPNVNLILDVPQIYKMFNSARNLIIFEQINTQRLVTPSIDESRKYREKGLAVGDAFFKCGEYFGKYKMPID